MSRAPLNKAFGVLMRHRVGFYAWPIAAATAAFAAGLGVYANTSPVVRLYELLRDQELYIRATAVWIDMAIDYSLKFFVGSILVAPLAYFAFRTDCRAQAKLSERCALLLQVTVVTRSLLISDVVWEIPTILYWGSLYVIETALFACAVVFWANVGCRLRAGPRKQLSHT